MRVERAGGFLCFYGSVARVYSSEDAALCGAAAAENILARCCVLAIVAVRAERADAQAEEQLVCSHDEDAKPIYRCQGVPR